VRADERTSDLAFRQPKVTAMGKFFREFWLWIVVPFVLVIAAVAWLAFSGGDDSVAPFTYEVF
jgi:hypothetical protein